MNWVHEALEKCANKLAWVSEANRNGIPYTTTNGIYDDRSTQNPSGLNTDGINWWCNGFWAGMLWMLYHHTGEQRYADIARVTEKKLDACFDMFYGLHHDLGFMWMPSAAADYRLTGDADARRRALHAANLLAGRFNPAGRFIRAWNELPTGEDTRGWAIIDCMFNLSLLYWASEETGDPRFRHMAAMHAETVRQNFIRPNGSVCHIVEFNPETGERVRDYGGQGYAKGSAWTRGQGWGLYGFMISHHHTGKPEFLSAAKQIADNFIAHIPSDDLIPVDFDQPAEPDWHDDTAAAIAGCGLIELAKALPMEQGAVYRDAAERIVRALVEQHCDFSSDTQSIVQKCTGAYHSSTHEHPMIYGDFYLLEALLKLADDDFFIW